MSFILNNPVPLDPVEWITRTCYRKRSENYTARHDFTVKPDVFDEKNYPNLPKHVELLYRHLAQMIKEQVPERESSASKAATLVLQSKPIASDLIKSAKQADYEGKGGEQHPIVQAYLRTYDSQTLATECPVFNAEMNGFIDILRVVGQGEDSMIEVIDFKPNASKDKKAATQTFRYKYMLVECAGISPDKIRCIWFDNQNAYQLIE